MGDLVPRSTGNSMAAPVTSVRARRAVARVEERTLTRMASVRGHSMVQSEKSDEIDRLARGAMAGQAMLSKWAATLAEGDAFLADDLKFFLDVAKMGKGEIIADTITDFHREGR